MCNKPDFDSLSNFGLNKITVLPITGKESDSGVSPVIGVILMVAVTVALVALVTVVVFDIGGDVSESPDATVQLSEDTANSAVNATVLRNENVDYFYLDDGSKTDPGSGSASLSSAGDTSSISGLSAGDTVNVIAVMPDGSSEVLTSTEYDG